MERGAALAHHDEQVLQELRARRDVVCSLCLQLLWLYYSLWLYSLGQILTLQLYLLWLHSTRQVAHEAGGLPIDQDGRHARRP
eukprot:scaffold10881_cov63-Phaeocystis_antarctica.AAC.2